MNSHQLPLGVERPDDNAVALRRLLRSAREALGETK